MKRGIVIILIIGAILAIQASSASAVATYPAVVKSFTRLIDRASAMRADQINGAYDEIEAIETAIGVNPKGTAASLVARLAVSLTTAGAISTASSAALDGGITVDSTNFTVHGTTGAVHTAADFDVATNKFTVAAATGDTVVAGTLGVTGVTTLTGSLAANGGITVDSTNFTVHGTTGAVHTAADFDVATNKFTVASATGNTVVAGTLGVKGGYTNLEGTADDGGELRIYTQNNVYNYILSATTLSGNSLDLTTNQGQTTNLYIANDYSGFNMNMSIDGSVTAGGLSTGIATWTLGAYAAGGAPTAEGTVSITIGGTTYKLLASTD